MTALDVECLKELGKQTIFVGVELDVKFNILFIKFPVVSLLV